MGKINTTHRATIVLLHLAFWLFLGAVNFLLFGWIDAVNQMLQRSLANVLVLAFLFYLNAFVFIDRFFERRKYLLFGFASVAAILVFVPVRIGLNQLFPVIANENPARQFKAFAIAALLTNIGIVLLSSLYQITINRFAQERRAMATINQQKEAELQFLKAQINPHFLFNTLNNIYSLAVVRSAKTAEMVLQLSNLLRYVIYESQHDQVSLDKEVGHIQGFIDLFKMRSEEAPDIRFVQKGNFAGFGVEPMVLIPLVENCFKHCDFDTNEAAFVAIEIAVDGQTLVFRTLNTKNKADKQKDGTGGVGLENIRRRLDLKHEGAYQMTISDHGATFEVLLSIQP